MARAEMKRPERFSERQKRDKGLMHNDARWLAAGRAVLLTAMAAIMLTGCATSQSTDKYRLTRYRPDEKGRQPWRWTAERTEKVAPVAATQSNAPTGTVAATEAPTHGTVSEPLNRGDVLAVSLRGIPNPEEFQDVVDDLGNITLPLLGKIKVEGKTTSEAETVIESAYVEGGIYRKIDVIIVAQAGEYFVRGEVKREGKYPVRGNLTLLQAIAEAGGFTDFAKRTDIKVIRGDQDMRYNTERIEDREEKDPIIKPGDNIIVPRRRF
jgi:protein involved in polysaccharide export with SLBB domain